jgi:hypothetical protein
MVSTDQVERQARPLEPLQNPEIPEGMTLIGPRWDSSLCPFYPGDGMLAVCILFYHHHLFHLTHSSQSASLNRR